MLRFVEGLTRGWRGSFNYHMRKVCFAGPKDSALNLFFICCFVVASFNFSFFSFSSPQDILQEEKKKKKQAIKVPLVFLCVFEYYKVL